MRLLLFLSFCGKAEVFFVKCEKNAFRMKKNKNFCEGLFYLFIFAR